MKDCVRLLYLCAGNSCRSQMAEAFTRNLKSRQIEAYSAGLSSHGLNRVAVRVMAEVGIDISRYRSKTVSELRNVLFDYVITVCDLHGCAPDSVLRPYLLGSPRMIQVAFDDPPVMARNAASDEEAIGHYRRVRDEIRRFVDALPENLTELTAGQEEEKNMSNVPNPEEVREKVRAGYARIAKSGGTCSCCAPAQPAPAELAAAIGYSRDELEGLPEGANMGLGCGNPTALASLHERDTVVDLGSGGGFDAFIAGRKIGPQGRVIGVDMTPDMVAKARENAKVYTRTTQLDNVEFRLGEIEHLPISDNTADVVISNCVINLSPDKPQVWREIARVLKPGGRAVISDLAVLRPLPREIFEMVEALVGCLAGAVSIEQTRTMAQSAGLVNIVIDTKPGRVDAMVDWNDPMYRKVIEKLPAGTKPGDYFTSANITAYKPSCCPGEQQRS